MRSLQLQTRSLALLDADRADAFDPAQAPMMRGLLIQLPDGYRFVLTHHHLLLDGWSVPLLVKEFFALYAGTQLPPPMPYRDYLAWLANQDSDKATSAWSDALAGLAEPTLVAGAAQGDAAPPPSPRHSDPALTQQLVDLSRDGGVDLSLAVQAAWGIVLAGMTGRQDVVFGTTVSGRPAELPGSSTPSGCSSTPCPCVFGWTRRRPSGSCWCGCVGSRPVCWTTIT